MLRFPCVLIGRQDLNSMGCAFGKSLAQVILSKVLVLTARRWRCMYMYLYAIVRWFCLICLIAVLQNLISLVETLMKSQKRSMPTQAQSVRRVTAKSDKFAKKSSTRKYPTSASRDNQQIPVVYNDDQKFWCKKVEQMRKYILKRFSQSQVAVIRVIFFLGHSR